MNVHSSGGVVLPTHRDLFYGGEWHKPRSGSTVAVDSPATGETLCSIAVASSEDVEPAITAA